jgi:hypothetical protein
MIDHLFLECSYLFILFLVTGGSKSLKQTVSKMRSHWPKKHADLPPCGDEEKYRMVVVDDDILSVRSLMPVHVMPTSTPADDEFDPNFIFDGPFEGSGFRTHI